MEWMVRGVMAGLIMTVAAQGLPAQTQAPRSREETIRTVATVTGAIGGLGIGALLMGFYGLLPEGEDALFVPDVTVGDRLFVGIPTTIVFACTSALATRVFADIMMRAGHRPWVSIPLGAGLGAVAGAFVGVTGWMTMAGIGHPAGAITSGDGAWYQVLGWSFLGGALWGGLSGIIPGAIGGPVVSIAARSGNANPEP